MDQGGGGAEGGERGGAVFKRREREGVLGAGGLGLYLEKALQMAWWMVGVDGLRGLDRASCGISCFALHLENKLARTADSEYHCCFVACNVCRTVS